MWGDVVGKLTDRTVRALGPGRHGDGNGLHLVVSATGRRTWILRYQKDGKRRDMGLGAYPAVGLADARSAAIDARRLLAQGADPVEAKRAAKKSQRQLPTFGDLAKTVIEEAQAKSTNAKVRYQWERHLGEAYCKPLLNRLVHEITTHDVAQVLRPVWRTKPEVARKLYPAIRRVFEYARIKLRDDHGISLPENPARWDDLKAMGFEAPAKLSRGNHPSLPYGLLPKFMSELRERDALSARALEFLILTNLRTEAVLKAKWADFDLKDAVWTVPLVNLKDRKHRSEGFRVPLPGRAVEILQALETTRTSEFVFPSDVRRNRQPKNAAPLSNMALLTLLKRMQKSTSWTDPASGRPITAHGFRATFRTWAEETTGFAHAVIEQAMGHVVGTEVERAYRRTDVLERRRELMEAWSKYCAAHSGGNVVPLRPAI